MSIQLPDVALTGSPFTLNTNSIQLAQTAWLEFLNESPYTLQVSAGGLNINVPAWYDYPLQVQSKSNGYWNPVPGAQFPVSVTPNLLTNQTNFPSTTLKTTLYQPGETPAITTPQPLVREVNANVSNAITLTNTGYAAGTIFISATPVLDDPGAAGVTITNDGLAKFGDAQNNGQITVTGKDHQQVIVSSDSASAVDTTGHTRAFMGIGGFSIQDAFGNILATLDSTGALKTFNTSGVNLVSIDNAGNIKIFDTAGHNRILMDANGNLTFLNAAGTMIGEFRGDGILFCDDHIPLSGDTLQLHDQSGGVQLRINSTGVIVSNVLNLPLGTLTRVKSFTAAVTTTTTFFNHNLGVIPDIVLIQVQGALSTIRTCVYDPATMTTTQVSLTGSGSFNVIGLAIKF